MINKRAKRLAEKCSKKQLVMKDSEPILCRVSYRFIEKLKDGGYMNNELEIDCVNLRDLFSGGGSVIAFDVDKLCGGVYIVMSDVNFIGLKGVERWMESDT